MEQEEILIEPEDNEDLSPLTELSDKVDEVVEDEELTLEEKVEELKNITADIQQIINNNVTVVTRDLAELLTNSVNMVNKYYEIFFDPNPHYVELQQYNSAGELVSTMIPNRSLDKAIALSGEGSPEGIIEAHVGVLYIDNVSRDLYIKKVGNGTLGWNNITPKKINVYTEEFTIDADDNATSIENVTHTLKHTTSEKSMIDVYCDGVHLSPDAFELDIDGQTVIFNQALPVNKTIAIRYVSGLYGVAGEKGEKGDKGDTGDAGKAATIRIGLVNTGAPGTNTSVVNRGTTSQAIFDFTIPRGDKGEKGDTGLAATLQVGSVATGEAGSDVIISNSGTENDAILDITIPRGDKGERGDTGFSGVYCGETEPEDETVNVWIDITGETNLLGGLSLPMSDNYKELTLGESGEIFEADNHGYLIIAKKATEVGQYIQIDGTHESLTNKSMIFTGGTAVLPNNIVYCPPIPMARGQQVKITYNVAGDTVAYRFIYTMATVTHPEQVEESGE